MEYTKLGRANVTVSKICLGTMRFGGVTSEAEAWRIMDKALELGINFFDTANNYGRGRSEEIIGTWLQQGGGRREQIVLATKVYFPMVDGDVPNQGRGISAYKVRQQAADSLRRLQTDHIDLYQIHHIDRRITGEELWGTFGGLVDRGDAIYVGTSNYSGWGLAKHQMQALARGRMGIVSEQTQYNLLSRYPELEVIPAAQDFGIGVLAYMPLAGGLLTGKSSSIEGSRTRSIEQEYGIRLSGNKQLESYSALCRELGEEERIVAIAWVLSNPVVSSAIVGIRTLEHLEGVERAASLRLDQDTIGRLDELFAINRGRALKPGPAPEAHAV